MCVYNLTRAAFITQYWKLLSIEGIFHLHDFRHFSTWIGSVLLLRLHVEISCDITGLLQLDPFLFKIDLLELRVCNQEFSSREIRTHILIFRVGLEQKPHLKNRDRGYNIIAALVR